MRYTCTIIEDVRWKEFSRGGNEIAMPRVLGSRKSRSALESVVLRVGCAFQLDLRNHHLFSFTFSHPEAYTEAVWRIRNSLSSTTTDIASHSTKTSIHDTQPSHTNTKPPATTSSLMQHPLSSPNHNLMAVQRGSNNHRRKVEEEPAMHTRSAHLQH